jgi:hypothetical protein
MRLLFGFSLRLFLGLVAAKLYSRLGGLDSTGALLGLTVLFTAMAYALGYLVPRDGQVALPAPDAKVTGVPEDSRS